MAVLYIIATPIGNLQDLSQRALQTLKEVDLILCEDTRVTKKLLNYYEISKPTMSYHQHSKLHKMELISEKFKKGQDIALVSDAGTPSISDPGAKLIDFLLEHLPELKITPIPGPSAVVTALSVSGFVADKFVFLGFPPAKKKRKKFFTQAAKIKHTVVFYESCHRILKSLEEFGEVAGDRRLVVCQELTKKFETIHRGSASEIIQRIQEGEAKGEFVVVAEKQK